MRYHCTILCALFVLLSICESTTARRVDGVSKIQLIEGVIDLHGKTLKLEDGAAIGFTKTGKIINGSIIGRNSRIITPHDDCLGVSLQGSWNVSEIADSWFGADIISDDVIIQNINVLQDDKLIQNIWISRNHCISLSPEKKTGLLLSSNTKVYLDAELSIKGNSLQRYNIVSIAGKKNVLFSGGVVKGDVGKHDYVEGSTSEWGFGFYIYNSEDIAIEDVTVSYCIGDGFYISGDVEDGVGLYDHASKNISLRRCVVYDNRREGISLVHADGVLIEKCSAINMGQTEYTPPCYGINIEPNIKKSVRNVFIKEYKSVNSYAGGSFSSGGYQVAEGKSNRSNIVLKNCDMDKAVAIMSGAVTIDSSKMASVIIYPQQMPEEKVVISNCTIKGGNGIQLDGRKRRNPSKSDNPLYSFINCHISADKPYKPIPGFIWGTDLNNIKAEFVFENCEILMPDGEKRYNITSSFFPSSIYFHNCVINSKDYPIVTNGIRFVGCDIYCKYIRISSDKNHKDCLIKCKINTSDPKRAIVFPENPSQIPNYEISGNLFSNKKATTNIYRRK